MRQRLLIICPHFAPTNAADGHRVRICAQGLINQGWQLDILACCPDQLPINQTPLLTADLPPELKIHHVPCRPGWLGALARSATTSRNAWRFVKRAGDALLASGEFAGVFFSTTAFGLLPLAVRWHRRFGVPYVVDLQDPWLQTLPPGVPPPGGALRFALAMQTARRWEPKVLRQSAGIVSVSPSYGQQLTARYPDLASKPILNLAFGGSQSDLRLARSDRVKQTIFDPSVDVVNLVHVGRGGEDLWPSLKPALQALNHHPAARLHLIGTSYAPPGRQRESLMPLARSTGVADQVTEYPARIDYFQALRCMTDAAGIIVLASTDGAYNASKIHNCVLAGPPVLALVHPGSVAQSQWQDLAPHLTLINCRQDDAAQRVSQWMAELPQVPASLTGYPFEANQQATRLAEFLSQALLSPD